MRLIIRLLATFLLSMAVAYYCTQYRDPHGFDFEEVQGEEHELNNEK